MEYNEYKQRPGLTSGVLTDWLTHGTSMDLIVRKPAKEWSYGHYFEDAIRERITGKERTSNYVPINIVSTAGNSSECPPEVVQCTSTIQFENIIKTSKKNTIKRLWAEAYLDNYGKTLIPTDIWHKINRCVESVMRVKQFETLIEEYSWQSRNMTLAELLPCGQFQVCREWESDGIKKKSLMDWYLEHKQSIIIDFKLTTNLSQWISMLRRCRWIQAVHYTEGIDAQWIYVVASTEDPQEAGAIFINGGTMYERYLDLCASYDAWNRNGRIPKGYRETKNIRIYGGVTWHNGLR
jgi:hypothetical protein